MEVSAEEGARTLREHGSPTILVLFGRNWDTLGPESETSRKLDSSNSMGHSLESNNSLGSQFHSSDAHHFSGNVYVSELTIYPCYATEWPFWNK